MRALKVLVIVLGIVLVGGTVALVLAIVARVERHRAGSPPSVAAASPLPLRTSLPPGTRVVAAELRGDRLMVRVALDAGGEQVLLFDARTGALVATIDASTKP